MRYIRKNKPPQEFTDWLKQKNEQWQPTWDNFRGNEKSIVHKSLLKEQGFICCYCQISIALDSSHIEHLIPRGKYEQFHSAIIYTLKQYS